MPYIPHNRRVAVLEEAAETPGELNYIFSREIDDYIGEHGLSYQTINDVLGALEGAKLEFYRRMAVPYENTKILLHGDVYSKAKGNG